MRAPHSTTWRSLLAALLLLVFALGGGATAAPGNGKQVRITILQTTDVHHHANGADHVGLDVDPVTGTSAIGAYSRIAAYVNYVRSSARNPVLLVDSGDWTMGTLYDLTLGSRPLALAFFDQMRYDSVTLGNHEFDYGPRGLAQILASAQSAFAFHTPIVASNMALNGNTDLTPFFGPGKAIEVARIQELDVGVKVAYIGLMGKAAAAAAPASAPVSFADPASQYAAIQALVDLLRGQGVRIVIALSHSGTDAAGTSGEDVELARHVRGINVIASGHTHTALPAARMVANGTWNTYIINAGAYGTSVARIDLLYDRPTKITTLASSSNVAMTDANLAAIQTGLTPDALVRQLVRATDQQVNAALGAFFVQAFPDYDPANLATGIYHPVAWAAQDMVSNEQDPVPAPNGLGDLAADAVRAVPNAIIGQTPAGLPDYDFTPIQVGVVANATLRGALRGGVPISFADIYNALPLGISPDPAQLLPIGYPLIAAYMEIEDLKKLCALQLLLQTGLANAENYLNLSGIRYSLRSTEGYLYFKFATAAAVLQVTSQKATVGSIAAQQALAALGSLAQDGGAALLAAAGVGNPYAAAMVRLNDPADPPLSGGQIAANLGALGQTAGAAAAGASALNALIVGKAIAAIDAVAGFSSADAANLFATTDLVDGTRVRVSANLYAVLAIESVQQLFGTTINVYSGPSGTTKLSIANIPGLLANRIDAAPGVAGVQELKEWMALLSYVGSLPGQLIGGDYKSTSNFAQFPEFGPAVTIRNASYPLASLAPFFGTLAALKAAP